MVATRFSFGVFKNTFGVFEITFGVFVDLLLLAFLLKVVYLLQVVTTEVAPVVIGRTVGMDGQTGFLLVQQYFEEDVLILRTATIEDELQVRSHGEDVGTPPSLAFNFIEIVGTQVVAVDA